MKKNVMALSIAAMIGGLGFAGAASADVIVGTGAAAPDATSIAAGKIAPATATTLSVNVGGIGNALVVPYYNAQNGNMTVLHVTNTDQANGKLVKVRFRSASNSDDVLDFQLFMSPGDVWTAAVTADASGLAQLSTADSTCTVPAIGGAGQPFNNSTRLPSYASLDTRNAMTREGYVEIFNVADITNVTAWDASGTASATGTNRSPLYTAVKHVSGVAPCSVTGSAARTLVNNIGITDFTDGGTPGAGEAKAAKAGLQTPTGGLTGDWYIINVPQTTTFSGAATAVAANARANFTHFAQLGSPVAAVGAADTLTADPLFRTVDVYDAVGAVVTTAALPLLNYDVPDLSTAMIVNAGVAVDPRVQAGNLLGALAVTSVSNQYANDSTISAKTDWVFSMPARRYNVAANYAAVTGTSGATGPTSANSKYRLFTGLDTAAAATDAAANNWFYPAASAGVYTNTAPAKSGGNTTVDANGNICVYADGQTFFDREETSATAGPVFSPGTASSVAFCGEVSVLAFQDTGNSVLSASVARSTVTSGSYMNGWGVLDTSNKGSKGGLPLVGFSAIKLTNPQASAGMSGTYGITWPHVTTK